MPNILRHCARLILLMVLFRLESGQVEAALPFVHPLFSSHMVLQRDATDPVWGWAGPGVTVTVVVKDQNATVIQTSTAVADTNGRWQASVGPFPLVTNNAAYSLTISASGQTTVTLSDVLIGDVWLCAGQSNMAYSMNTIGVTNAAQETADSINYPSLRCFTVPEVEAATPQTNLNSTSWQVVNPSDAANITACGYFTAREIYKQQGIPIGILCSAWPGTEIESWVDAATATNISEFIQTNFDQTLQSPARGVVAYLYNAMIAPLPPFHIKAVEW
jgi:sialate O-acetylesterase